MINWPVRRKKSDSDWLRHASDADLAVLMALINADVPDKPESEAMIRDIKARALKRMRQERSNAARPVNVQADGDLDLASWLRDRWMSADETLRGSLRMVADALHIPLPMRRTRSPAGPEVAMRRTRPPLAEAPERSRIPSPAENARRRAAEGAVRNVAKSPEPAADEYMLGRRYDDESDWTPCTSLFDALYPENRGWS